MTGTRMKGFSHIRWWSRWELITDIAVAYNANTLTPFITELVTRDVAPKTVQRLSAILGDVEQCRDLELQMALVQDMKLLMDTTYLMEGSGLEVLRAHEMMERVRRFGGALHEQSSMPHVADVLRTQVKLSAGLNFRQHWTEEQAPGKSGWWEGKTISKNPGHGNVVAVRYTNGDEMLIKKGEEAEFRKSLIAHHLPGWAQAVSLVMPMFDYINNRLTNQCDRPYHCSAQHECLNLLQVFDPSKVAGVSPNETYVQSMFTSIPFFCSRQDMMVGLNAELPKYVKLAAEFRMPKEAMPGQPHFMKEFTKAVLSFWQVNASNIPTWAAAARIAFAVQPNSAESERVFSILTRVFGRERDACLADEISASLMLAYNQTAIG